jgi:hypothetical protein
MLFPYLLMAILYLSLAVLVAFDASLTSFTLMPFFSGLRWLRVHLITLGTLTEVVFGLLPGLVALSARRPQPAMRWDIWLALNAGLLILLVGIPLVNAVLVIGGGSLIFAAALLLLRQLRALRPIRPTISANGGRPFYLAGLSYLLLGIIVGSGLWFGWGAALRIAVPIEVHIHANNWGFMSLVFAGLIVDLYPDFAGRPLAWPRSIRPIFWMMVVGALGLALGPWAKSNWFSVPGLILHLSATIWLLLNAIVPLRGERRAWAPGLLHLITSYVWILAPVLVAPLIIFQVPGFPGTGIEQSAPQALIYGWVLQFGYAIIPSLFRRAFEPHIPARLGGNWFSLVAVHLGGIFLWASIFISAYQGSLHATAYALWALSALPILLELWRITRGGLAQMELATSAPGGESVTSGVGPQSASLRR